MIIISPYSKVLRNGAVNPKNYPWWLKVVRSLINQGLQVNQVGAGPEQVIDGVTSHYLNISLVDLRKLVEQCKTWVSIDNFFPHFCSHTQVPGVVIFGQSDPNVFGYRQNVNLLKDRAHLRVYQFRHWEQVTYQPDVFVQPEVVVQAVQDIISRR